MIRCDKCSSCAINFQKYSGMHLCKAHFDQDLERKVRETLRETKIFGQKARIALALSGGKDSSVLLYVLKKLFARRKDIEIVALLVDEGIRGYRSETLAVAKKLAERLEVPYIIRNFKDEFGVTTDWASSNRLSQAPCTFCGVMRKTLLNRAAREIGADALATGHNLDDEAQTVMLNILRGDIQRLFRLRPRRKQEAMVQRIKPLRRVPEREIAIYAMTHDLFSFDLGSCPYIDYAMRLEVKTMLNDFEAKHPGTKYSLLRSLHHIIELQPESDFKTAPCQRCGEPCSGEFCQGCKILEQLAEGQSL